MVTDICYNNVHSCIKKQILHQDISRYISYKTIYFQKNFSKSHFLYDFLIYFHFRLQKQN